MPGTEPTPLDPSATPVEADPAPDVLRGPDVARRVVRGGAVRILGYGAMNLLGVVSSVLLLRALGVEDFGRYGTVLALIAIAATITDAGLTITGSRELALRPKGRERREVLGAILGLRLALCSLGMVVAFAFGLLVGYDDAMLAGVALAGAGSVLLAAQATLGLPLVVDLRNGMVALSDLLKQTILVAGVAALAIAGDAGLVAFLAIQVPIGAISLAVMPLMVGRADRAWPRWHLGEWADIGLRALPVAAAAILAMVYVRVLTVMASLLTDDREVGLFVTSARVVEMVGALALLLAGVVLPVASVAAREDRGRLGYVLRRTTEISFLLGGLIALVLVVAARPIVELLGGAEYSDAGPVLAIQGVAIFTVFLVQAWVTFLIADHRQRDLVRAVVVGLVTVVVAGLLLIPPMGAAGAALAAVIADVVYAGAVFFMVSGRVSDVAPVTLGFVGKVLLALAPAVLIALIPGLPALAAAALGVLAFVAANLALRTVPPDVWSSLPSWPRRR